MIILIDGYNLLNHIFPGKKYALDKHRQLLIKHLGMYKFHKPSIREIIVVFDGGLSTHASRMVKEGVVIVESGTRDSADDWIIAFVARNTGKEILLITLDRALRTHAASLGADWLSVFDFYNLMQSVLMDQEQTPLGDNATDIIVYQHDNDDGLVNKHALALLMEQASVIVQNKLEDKSNRPRKGKSYTPSKIEKQIAAKIKKLGK